MYPVPGQVAGEEPGDGQRFASQGEGEKLMEAFRGNMGYRCRSLLFQNFVITFEILCPANVKGNQILGSRNFASLGLSSGFPGIRLTSTCCLEPAKVDKS